MFALIISYRTGKANRAQTLAYRSKMSSNRGYLQENSRVRLLHKHTRTYNVYVTKVRKVPTVSTLTLFINKIHLSAHIHLKIRHLL